MRDELTHHGIKGMKWGIRRTPEQLGKLSRKDDRWVKRNSDKVTAKTQKQVSKDMKKFATNLVRDPNTYTKSGKLSSAAITSYNRKLSELMNKQVAGMKSPSGKVVQFVAKRGELGVFMALADQGYNIDQLKNGIFSSGKVAYRSTVVDKVETDGRR